MSEAQLFRKAHFILRELPSPPWTHSLVSSGDVIDVFNLGTEWWRGRYWPYLLNTFYSLKVQSNNVCWPTSQWKLYCYYHAMKRDFCFQREVIDARAICV